MNNFNHLDYGIFHLGVSGGKDSTAALLWLVYESGWPLDRLIVTFCDTNNEDPFVYAYLKMLSNEVFPIQTIYPDRDFWELAQWKGRFPSARARFCTSFLKIEPSRGHVFSLMQDGANVLLLDGARVAEAHGSNKRGEIPQFHWNEGFACDAYHPILDWEIDEIWRIHRRYLDFNLVRALVEADPGLDVVHKMEIQQGMGEHRIPRCPLYDMGAVRVGCFPCINSRKAEIRAMAKYRPLRVEFLAGKEGAFKNSNMYSTFFARNTIPASHRSKEIITKSGERMMVATIRDVVEWSRTARGGKQYEMDIVPSLVACDLGGYCE